MSQQQLLEARNKAAARGSILSGNSVFETAKIEGARITSVLQSRLDLLLDGFQMYGVVLDEYIISDIVKELGLLRAASIGESGDTYNKDPINLSRLIPQEKYLELLGRIEF